MKIKLFLGVVLALALGIALVPTLTSAAEFSFDGPPAFTVTYPSGSNPDEKTSPTQVWAIKTGGDCMVSANVVPIPEGIELKDVAEKGYKPGLETAQGKVRMGDNKEITLGDGTKAYYSEMNWNHVPSGGTPITTMIVSAYKDGKWVYVDAHPWDNYNVPTKIVKSLKFK